MATAAVTPPKAPPDLQSAVVGALLSRTGLGSILPGISWIGASSALWNVYAQASGARPASAAPINAPSPAPQPHGHEGTGTQGRPERNIRFHLENAPPGTRVSTRASGTAFHIETGKAAQPGSAAARPKANGPADAAAHSPKPAPASKDVHPAADSGLSKALVAAELVGDILSPVSFLARQFTPLQLIHGVLGAASFIPELGSVAAAVDGAVYGVQALYAQSKGDDKAAKEYAASAALDGTAALIGVFDGDAGATKLGLQGARALASRGFALAGNTGGHIAMAGAGARGVLAAGKVRGAVVAAVDVLNNGKPQVSQSVGNGNGGGGGSPGPKHETGAEREADAKQKTDAKHESDAKQEAGAKADAVKEIYKSKDPHVGELATYLDAKMPGVVERVNKPIEKEGIGPSDADIQLASGDVIEVFRGSGAGKTKDIERIKKIVGDSGELMVFGPDVGKHAGMGIRKLGVKLFKTRDEVSAYLESKKGD